MWNLARDIGTETCCLIAKQRPRSKRANIIPIC
jgi:hypothetical protein